MKTTIENLIRNRMIAYTTYHIKGVEITYCPETPMYNAFYKVFAPGLGFEQFGTKQKALNYMINDLQL